MAKCKFRQIYDALPPRSVHAPKADWVRDIASICMVSEKTVRCWLAGTQHPDALRTSIIAKHLKVAESELFNV